MNLIRQINLDEGAILELQQRCEDGELAPDMVADTLEAIQGDIEMKADAIAELVSQNTANILAIKAEINRLKDIKDNLERSNEYFKGGLMAYLKRNGTAKLKTTFHSFSVCKNGGKLPLEITGDVPVEFIKYEPKADTEAITEALANGIELGFAHFGERGENLRIK